MIAHRKWDAERRGEAPQRPIGSTEEGAATEATVRDGKDNGSNRSANMGGGDSTGDDGNGEISEAELLAMISCDDDDDDASTGPRGQREFAARPKAPPFPRATDGGRGPRGRRSRLNCLFLTSLLIGVFVRPYRRLRSSPASDTVAKLPCAPLLAREETKPWEDARGDFSGRGSEDESSPPPDDRIADAPGEADRQERERVGISEAPLFYHVSPGSTGSRTLYHAACASGFPSVHHKSFCISRTRGIHGVDEAVVRGVRSHFKLLRLYEMASQCCSLRAKGKLNDGDTFSEDVGNNSTNDNGNGNRNSTISATMQRLCHMPLPRWSRHVQFHLADVLRSGLVGLFDTPYPYLAPQVLALADEVRAAPPIVAVTERDPAGWARSRVRHGILVCRDAHSCEGLGASEFDVAGCVERAADGGGGSDEELRLWDAFRWRSAKEAVNATFQAGMERQMRRHQEQYVPTARYAPDMFGVHLSAGGASKPMEESDVARDIRRLILGGKGAGGADQGAQRLRPLWLGSYAGPLTCRGRVNWEGRNDTLLEYYHVPRTCADMPLASKKARKTVDVPMIPLIPA